MAKPRATTIHKICSWVDERQRVSAIIRELEQNLRGDATKRFKSKRALTRVCYRVVQRGSREYVEYYELTPNMRLPRTKYLVTAQLSYRCVRQTRKMVQRAAFVVTRDKSFTTKADEY